MHTLSKVYFSICFIVLIYWSNSFSSIVGSINCEPRHKKYVYINGINTTWSMGKKTVDKMSFKLRVNNSIDLIHNNTHGLASDLKDSIFQKIEELKRSPWSLRNILSKSFAYTLSIKDNRESILQRIEKLSAEDSDLIVISHSQGNLYSNIACERMKAKNRKFHNIQIGTPANSIECGRNHHYTTLQTDEMYQLIMSLTSLSGGKLDISKNKYYKDAINLGLAPMFKVIALSSPIKSPLKANINQSPMKTSFFKFHHHSMENYLEFIPSISQIRRHHNQVLRELNKGSKELFSGKDLKVNCQNAANHIGESFHAGMVNRINGIPVSRSGNSSKQIWPCLSYGIYSRGDNSNLCQFKGASSH